MNGQTSRREFIKRVIYGGGTLFAGRFGSYFSFNNSKIVGELESQLKTKVQGKVITNAIDLAEDYVDFGHFIRKEPRVVVVPKKQDDIIATFHIANAHNIPVSIRGTGHTCMGWSLSDGGIVISNKSNLPDYSITDGMLSVSTRMKLWHVEQEINKAGLALPVIPTYAPLSVGGVLSAGGVGLRSVTYGPLAHNVVDLEMVTPLGDAITCSHEKNAEFFKYSLGGVGQLGVIDRALIKPIKLVGCEKVLIGFKKKADFDALSLLNSGLELIIEGKLEFCHVVLNTTIGEHFRFGKSFESEEEASKHKLAKPKIGLNEQDIFWVEEINQRSPSLKMSFQGASMLRTRGARFNLWGVYVFGNDNYKEFFKRYREDPLSKGVNLVIFLIKNNTREEHRLPFAPCFDTTRNYNDYSVAFRMGKRLPYGDFGTLRVYQNWFQKMLNTCISLGGRPYHSGWLNLSHEQKVTLYGQDFLALEKFKEKIDPNSILNPGTWI